MARTKEFDYRGSSSEFIMKIVFKKIYGFELDDLEKEHALLVEKDKALEKIRKKNHEKELNEIRLHAVLKLHAEGWTAMRIADVLDYDLDWVEQSIKPIIKK